MVPETTSAEEPVAAPPNGHGEVAAPIAFSFVAPEPQHDTDLEAPYSSPFVAADEAPAPEPTPPPEPEPPPPRPIEPTVPLARPAPPEVHPEASPPVPRRSAWPFVAAFAGLGLAVAAVSQMRSNVPPEPTMPTAIATATTLPPTSAIATATVSAPAPTATSPTSLTDDLPPGAEVPPGYGLVEVTAPAGSRVRIDGAIGGAGPLASLVAAPGYHEVRVEQDGHDTKQVIEVRAGKTTRVKPAPPP